MNDESLSQVNGGFWGSLFAGFAQVYDGGVTLDQLNGRVIRHPSRPVLRMELVEPQIAVIPK